MIAVERTRQQLDPVGTLSSRTMSIVFAVGAFVYGAVQTVRNHDQINSQPLALLALVWLAGAAFVVVFATSRERSPLTSGSHVLVHLLALGAVTLSIASQWGTNAMVHDDFGPMSLGFLMLALGPYRPATELAAAGSLSAVFIGFLTLLEVPNLPSAAPPVAYVFVGMAPVLAFSYGAATYAGRIVDALERWQRRAMSSVVSRTSGLREGIARSVQNDRVMILGRDVLPFFNTVLEAGTLTNEDRTRAREIADSIRTLMVAEADRSWLEVVAADNGVAADHRGRTVIDPTGSASSMVSGQRTALRALIVALLDEPTYVPNSMRIVLNARGPEVRGVLTARLYVTEAFLRSTLAPYFAVMRIVFSGLQIDFDNLTLTIGFTYEQR